MDRLKIPQRLAGNPENQPKYAQVIKSKKGDQITLADPNATRALVALMDMAAVIGGAASHFGGPAAFAEIMSALHGFAFKTSKEKGGQWYDHFHLVNDAGHCENGIYALKANYNFGGLSIDQLMEFRSIKSPLTGHGEVDAYPEGVYVSNGPLGSGLPQAQGLAFADALSKNPRVTVTAISDGGCMEGEAKEAFAAIPGLAAAGKLAPFICIISDNNTKLSGRIDQEAFSMSGSFTSLGDLGWEIITVDEGHNLEKCYHSIEEAYEKVLANPKKPVALHVKTIKGKGTKATEESASGAHGFPLKKADELTQFLAEIYSGQAVPEEMSHWIGKIKERESAKPKSSSASDIPKEKIQVGITQAMVDMRKKGFPVVSISSDLAGSTGTAGFRKEFPEFSQDVGVAEANMVSMGIGLSKAGYIPVVDTFSQFGVTKGSLPIIMSNLSEGPVIAVFSHTGFQDAADGASHQALSYFAMLSAIPKVDVYCLTSSSEAYALMAQAIEKFAEDRRQGEVPHSQIFFLGRENFQRTYLDENYSYELGKAQVLIDRADQFDRSVTIAAAGSLLPQAISAAEILAAEGVGSIVINPSTINRPDVSCFQDALRKTDGRLVTLEDHRSIAGMGSMLIHRLNNEGIATRSRSLGVGDQFGQSSYTAIELYQKHGLDDQSVVRAAKTLVE